MEGIDLYLEKEGSFSKNRFPPKTRVDAALTPCRWRRNNNNDQMINSNSLIGERHPIRITLVSTITVDAAVHWYRQ